MDTNSEKNPENYFVTDLESQYVQEEGFSEKIRPVQDTAQKGLIKILPTLIRLLNTTLYYAVKIIRGAVNIAVSQIRQ